MLWLLSQAMWVSVPLTPTPEMPQTPHVVSSFRKEGPFCCFLDVAEVGGEGGLRLLSWPLGEEGILHPHSLCLS